MQIKKSKRLHNVTIEYKNGVTQHVRVKAVDREAAERRALKFHPSAVRIKSNASA